MKKKTFTSSLFCMLLALNAVAQQTTIRVQGAPRKVSNTVAARILKAADATSSTAIDFAKIERWAGEGDCRAALAIKWADGQNDGKTLVWGYRWNSGEQKTGEDMLRAVAKADPSLYIMADPNTAYGFTVGGMGYDTDADRYVTLTTMTDEIYPRCGMFSLPYTEFDMSASTAWGSDAWNNGYFTTGFWNYYIADDAADALDFAPTGAGGRTLTDGCVDAYLFGYYSAEDGTSATYDGNLEYLPAATDYTRGAFIVNEDWYGHRNSTANFISREGQFVYNNTTELGCTACFGAAWGNRYYIISKQAKDPGAAVEGGRINICDANSMRVIKQIADIDGKDGRSFCGIDEHKAYVSTSGGIYTLDLDNMEVGSAVKNAYGSAANLGECGNMVHLDNYVFAVEYGKRLQVIDPETDRIIASTDATIYSLTLAKDGSLWASTADGIARVNTSSFMLEMLPMPDGFKTPAYSLGGWSAEGLCASTKRNVIYWPVAYGWSTTEIYSYDIDNNEFKKFANLVSDTEFWRMYSTSNMRVDPVTDELYVGIFKDYDNTDYAVRRYAADGTLLAQYDLEEKNYWFPGMFVFPDSEDPVVADIDDITVEEGKDACISLAQTATDADNMQAAITKSVESVADGSVAEAAVDYGKLYIWGKKPGTTTVTVKFCSNGITATKDININVTAATGINAATGNTADVHEVARYAADGRRISTPQQGMNIVRYSDGTTRKVVVE